MTSFAHALRKNLTGRSQRGQSIVLIAMGMIALLAFVGLVTDISLLMVRFSQLRRAVDSASIAAAGQVRENRDYADIALTARQFIRLHGLDPDRILVQTCVTNPDDPTLCTNPPRKMVRVVGQIDSPTTFLSLLGWGTITLEASSVAETAQLDVALVIDTSESMSRSTDENDYLDIGLTPRAGCSAINHLTNQPNYESATCCNNPGNGLVDLGGTIYFDDTPSNVADDSYADLVCQPFKQVRDAARAFVQRLDFVRGDRVTFVTFDTDAIPITPEDPENPGNALPPLLTSEGVAINTLDDLMGVRVNPDSEVYNLEGEAVWNDCRTFTANPPIPVYTYDWIAPCSNTNMGGGIQAANAVLTQPEYIRRTAVWVIILLGDGAANRTPRAAGIDPDTGQLEQVNEGDYGYYGFCPWWTFCDASAPDAPPECTSTDPLQDDPYTQPFCADADILSRHFCTNDRGVVDINAPNCDLEFYDAMDYTMDMADFSGLVEIQENVPGNFIAMYTIGFGTPTEPIETLGEAALRYVADAGDNGLIDNDWQQDCREDGICGNHVPDPDPAFYGPPGECEDADPLEDCGQYWYAESSADLERVFAEIASRLFTRLSR